MSIQHLPAPHALILGLDTPAGAYLARLLHARGQQVSGIAAAAPALLPALGAQDDITELPSSTLASPDSVPVFPHQGVVYLVSQPHPGAEALAQQALATAPATTRLVHVADHGLLLAHAPARSLAQQITRLRRDSGRFAANAILHPHDSRLGPKDALPARIIAAAHRASQTPSPWPDLPHLPPQDWGWTPEYVDAVARLAALPIATDIEVASGVPMTAHEMATHAARWFRLDPSLTSIPVPSIPAPSISASTRPPDTARLKTLLGWRATTTGADLMAALCEAVHQRAGNGP